MDSLRMFEAENEALSKILRTIQSIDTARQSDLIQWIITDRTVRSRVISALRKNGYTIAPNSVAEMTVTQTPPTDMSADPQLLQLIIDQAKLSGDASIARILGPNLHDMINQRAGYEYTLISTEPSQQKVQFVAMDASLFGGSIVFKSGFGFAVNVGDDYIGYPFWLPGTIGTYGLLRRGTTDFRAGIEWPLGQSGASPFSLSSSMQIKERKLTGSQAFAAEIKQDLGLLGEQSGKIHFGLEFRDAFTPSFNSLPSFAFGNQFMTDTNTTPGAKARSADTLYYLAISAHGYLSYRLPDQVLKGAYVQVGGGMHGIQPFSLGAQDRALHPGDVGFQQAIVTYDRKDYWEPFIKLGYVHSADAGDEYGVSVQYSNELLTDAWVKLFTWLQLEVKYASVVFRDPKPWEWKDYVMVSPKLTLNF
jgi:hypothetical protein